MIPAEDDDYRYGSSEASEDDYEESDEEQEDPSDYCKGMPCCFHQDVLI